MFRRNPDVLAVTIVVLVIGAVSALADLSHFVVRNLADGQRQQHLERRVELIGQRIEEKASQLERHATRVAERAERIAQEHAKRAERIAKIWE
jgi:sensor domain CHASE-containing protein